MTILCESIWSAIDIHIFASLHWIFVLGAQVVAQIPLDLKLAAEPFLNWRIIKNIGRSQRESTPLPVRYSSKNCAGKRTRISDYESLLSTSTSRTVTGVCRVGFGVKLSYPTKLKSTDESVHMYVLMLITIELGPAEEITKSRIML